MLVLSRMTKQIQCDSCPHSMTWYFCNISLKITYMMLLMCLCVQFHTDYRKASWQHTMTWCMLFFSVHRPLIYKRRLPEYRLQSLLAYKINIQSYFTLSRIIRLQVWVSKVPTSCESVARKGWSEDSHIG